MSNKREREKRREERLREETKVDSTDRRKKLLQLSAGVAFLVVVAVVVLIVVNSGGGSGGDVKLENVATVDNELDGIPQKDLVLGDPKAKVQLYEYGDLQCPVCKQYSEEVLPPLFAGPVKNGEATITFRNFTIIGPESVPAGTAALAAGKQGRGWYFLELFYRNQGKENAGYVTEDFLAAVAKGAGVEDIAKWEKESKSKELEAQVQKETAQAQTFGFSGTPSFAIKGPNTKGIELLGTPGSAEALEEAIEEAS